MENPEEPLPPLLRLPPSIRRRVYFYLGLASWDGRRPYRFDLHGRKASEDAPNPNSFHGLLLSCRVIYAEAAALLYSANQFVLHYAHGHPEPLAPLQALTSASLASMAALKIVLNQASCHHEYEYDTYPFCCLQGSEDEPWGGAYRCRRDHADLHHRPLLAPSPVPGGTGGSGRAGDVNLKLDAAQDILSKWQSAAARLSCITIGRLELALVCDIDPQHEQTLNVALSVVAPLRGLPQLKDCSIRLGKTPDSRLQQVAHDFVLQACGIAAPPYYSKPSALTTLTSLPRELRLRILEYTDLIVPSGEVTWSRQYPGYITSPGEGTRWSDDPGRPRFFHCWYNGDGLSPFTGCFCRRRHAAFSFTCKCWAPPTPLFLICRTLLHDAQLVFFSRNRFIVHDYRSCPPWGLPHLDKVPEGAAPPIYDYPNARLAASQFLREIVPPHCLAHLRFLELVFPPYRPPSWPQADHPAMQDWRATVDWARDKLNLPGLTLRLVGAEVSDFTPDAYRYQITVAEGDAAMESYMALLWPLRQLADGGLARFYADFAWPWQWTEAGRGHDTAWDAWGWLQDRKREVKERAERYVMGERYEGLYPDGRKEPEPSFWSDAYYSHV
jgi:hypothetical protein